MIIVNDNMNLNTSMFWKITSIKTNREKYKGKYLVTISNQYNIDISTIF